jgi:peroxiredoxin
MKKIIYCSISLFILLVSFKPGNNSSKIFLKTSGFPDSTLIYLVHMETATKDSGYIINNELVFNVDVVEPTPFQINPVYITRESFEYRSFWKENRQLTIRAEKGNLNNARIEGSEIQVQADFVKDRKDKLTQLNDSLLTVYRSLEDKKSEEALALRAKRKEVTNAIIDVDVSYVKNNPDQLFSAITLKQLMTYTIPKDKTAALYETLSAEMQATKYGRSIKKYLELSRDLKVGDKAPDFQLPDLNGDLVGLKDFEGKYILLDFWGSGCGPCRMENPNLLRNYKAYRDKGFEIISISFDKKREGWVNAVKKDSMIWTTVCDLQGGDGDVIMTYKVYFMPTYFIIDPDGFIIDKFLGTGQLDEKLTEIFSAL